MIEDASAPGRLSLIESFCNTLDLRRFRHRGIQHSGGDSLGTAAELTGWLVERGLLEAPLVADEANLELGHELRAVLRAAVNGADGFLMPAGTTELLTRLPLRLDLRPDQPPTLQPAVTGVPGALARLLTIAAEAAGDGSWARLRLCAAQDCRWAFFDASRSGAGRWCSMAACGNRNKTRRYRVNRAATPLDDLKNGRANG